VTGCHADQLALRVSELKMEPTQNTFLGTRIIILYKMEALSRNSVLGISLGVKDFREETSRITENLGSIIRTPGKTVSITFKLFLPQC